MRVDINSILKRPCHSASSPYGASMGRRNQVQGSAERLHLQRVRFIDGDYDSGGAYWGGGRDSLPLWCAFSPDSTLNEEPIMIFVRARSRNEAKQAVDDCLVEDGFTFFR
jgi:hypothetical protein